MKTSRRCPKCQSRRVGFLEHVLDKGKLADEDASVGVDVRQDGGWLLREAKFTGALETYVCGDCGYFEHYVKVPRSVDFDRMAGFHWLNETSPSHTPYR